MEDGLRRNGRQLIYKLLLFRIERTCNGPVYSNQYFTSSGGVSSNNFFRAFKSCMMVFMYDGMVSPMTAVNRRRGGGDEEEDDDDERPSCG